MLKALIFDFDGTIIDTEKADLESWQEIFAEHQVPFDTELFLANLGRAVALVDLFDHLESGVGHPVNRGKLRRRKKQLFLDRVAELDLRPGVRHWIGQAGQRGIMLGIASCGSRTWIEMNLHRLGMLEQFDAVIGRDHLKNAKPDPEVYLQALHKLGVGPAEAVAVEDSPNGIAAAKAAGIFTVAAPSSCVSGQMCAQAELVVDALNEQLLDDLAARMNS